MNPLGLISGELTAATASGAMPLIPELFGGLPRSLAAAGLNQQHYHDDTHQTILDHYGMISDQTLVKCPINQLVATTASVNVGTGTEHYEDDDDDEHEQQMLNANQFANQFVNQFTTHDDENSIDNDYDGDDGVDDIDEYNGGTDSNNSNSVGFNTMHGESSSSSSTALHGNILAGNIPFRRRTRGTQTSRKIKPVKRPGLVLKTPIAYQPCLDPSVIPIQKDGMGTFVLFLIFVLSFSIVFLFFHHSSSLYLCLCLICLLF